MKALFEILPSVLDTENCKLIMEVSSEGVACAIKNEETNTFQGIAVYHFDKSRPQSGFSIALQILIHQKEWLAKKFKKSIIVYSFPESVLVPYALYDRAENENVLHLLHGGFENEYALHTDVLASLNVYNVFRVPKPLNDVIESHFTDATCMHQYTALLNKEKLDGNVLSVIFYAHKMVVSLLKDGRNMLVNSYGYRTGEDVSYHLLNICKEFKIENPFLEINGLLEENSVLYKELYKYFLNIHFSALLDNVSYDETILQYPAHYFSHIFALDTCE